MAAELCFVLALAADRIDREHPVPASGPDHPWRRPRRMSRIPSPFDDDDPVEVGPMDPAAAAMAAIKDVRLEQLAARRRDEARAHAGEPGVRIVHRSPGWRGARPVRVLERVVGVEHEARVAPREVER